MNFYDSTGAVHSRGAILLAVAAINAWNRLAIAARTEPGKYQPKEHLLKKGA
jgi:hypothetical protein